MRVSFRKLPDRQYAEVDLESKIITIDLAKNTNPARCYLHEKLHLRHPKLSEKKIRQMETLIWNRMTAKAKYKLYKELFSHPYQIIRED